ncbi:MAG TPA: hypothetical protein VH188_13645 [Chthoniobacterales bacterium]|jgi:hypothetical protein|nr:hypothetical protein [Chthoniobacterales bacterium]
MKKFLSNSLSSGVGLGVGDPLATGEVLAVVVVVVAGDIPGTVAVAIVLGTAGLVPGTAGDVAVTGAVAGDMAGAVTGAVAGLMAVVGGGAGGRLVAGAVVGGGWPNEVSARVNEKRLAISSVFIGLIKELSRPRIPMSWVSS